MALAWLVLIGVAAIPIVRYDGGGRYGGGGSGGVETVPVRIEHGDTLWGLAREIDPSADPRQLITVIMELNDLPSDWAIRPGDTVLVPVSAD